MARNLMVGESLVGDGNEVAHIDLMIGPKDGPVGAAFAQRLAAQTSGHNALLPGGHLKSGHTWTGQNRP